MLVAGIIITSIAVMMILFPQFFVAEKSKNITRITKKHKS